MAAPTVHVWIQRLLKKIAKFFEKALDIFKNSAIMCHASERCGCSSSGRAPPCQGGGSEFEPRHPLQTDKERACVPYFIRYRGQVVRQESAKLSFTRSNRVGTSKKPSRTKFGKVFTFSLFTLHFSLIPRARNFLKVISNSE